MKRSAIFGLLLALTAVLTSPSAPAQAVVTCTPTGFFRDGINMTAAVINPTVTVTGTIDATGCNIGVYFSPGTTGSVSGAEIFGANYFGVAVQGASVNVSGSNVHDIGETPLNGSQHGLAIYYATVDNGSAAAQPACAAGVTKGTINGNTVSSYQKGGIVVNCTGTTVTVSNNNVIGEGPVNYIAQNGIQISRGATGGIKNNVVSGHQYTGTNWASSAGILLFGGCGTPVVTGVSMTGNTVVNNDVGLYMFNANADCNGAPSTPTKNSAVNNTITNALTTNYNGWDGIACGYQAGISNSGNRDSLQNNKISGVGYAVSGSTSTGCGTGETLVSRPIDTSFASIGLRDHRNVIAP